jgi:hypothetical protein
MTVRASILNITGTRSATMIDRAAPMRRMLDKNECFLYPVPNVDGIEDSLGPARILNSSTSGACSVTLASQCGDARGAFGGGKACTCTSSGGTGSAAR